MSFDVTDDLQRAEAFLNADTWLARLGRGFGAAGIVLLAGVITLLFSTAVNASPAPVPVLRAPCGTAIRKIQYTAGFSWKSQATGQSLPMRLEVGETEQGELTAQIWSDKDCQATCKPMLFEKEEGAPRALQMQCRSAQLGSFSSTVTLLWSHGRSLSNAPSLRFGTWLQGYQDAPLLVERDQYSVPALRAASRTTPPSKKKSAQLAYRTPHLAAHQAQD